MLERRVGTAFVPTIFVNITPRGHKITCPPYKAKKNFTTEAQSIILLTAPVALLTIQIFSLCPLRLCGEKI